MTSTWKSPLVEVHMYIELRVAYPCSHSTPNYVMNLDLTGQSYLCCGESSEGSLAIISALTLYIVLTVYLPVRCEQALISAVTVRNCIRLYQTSEEHSAESLKNYCLQIISSHWVGVYSLCVDMCISVRLLLDLFISCTCIHVYTLPNNNCMD